MNHLSQQNPANSASYIGWGSLGCTNHDDTRGNQGDVIQGAMNAGGGSGIARQQEANYLIPFVGGMRNNAGVNTTIYSREKNQDSDKTLSFREWIKCALQCVGENNGGRAAVSSAYLESSIKVANYLTVQIIQAEKLAAYGISDRIDVLPVGPNVDWARFATVRLKTDANITNVVAQKIEAEHPQFQLGSNDEGKSNHLTYASLTTNANSCLVDESSKEPNMDQQFEAFLEKIGVNELDNAGNKDDEQDVDEQLKILFQFDEDDEVRPSGFGRETVPMTGLKNDAAHSKPIESENQRPTQFASAIYASASSNAQESALINQDLSKQLEAYYLERFGVNDLKESGENLKKYNNAKTSAKSTNHTDKLSSASDLTPIDYLNVHSAEIKCPKSDHMRYFSNRDGIISRDQLQRQFNLGLVFYELFSGGEVPPFNLRALASLDGAFVSLSTVTLVKEVENDQGAFSENKRHQGPSGNLKMVGLCELSFEYLTFTGIPRPLCHLIFNMLNCVYGDLSGVECYTNIADVQSDLQLMIDKPKYLQGLGANEMSSPSLQLNDISIPREEELQSILSSYRRCLAGSSEFVIIQGESGSGKSLLAHQVGSLLIEEGGLFLIGKYDQLQQSKPFAALAAALDQYCDVLISQLESNWAKGVVNKLQTALGRDACFLVLVLPKLTRVLNANSSHIPLDTEGDCQNAVQRIQYLLCQFIEVISTTSIVSVTLFLDDVQWVDEASIPILNRILTLTRSNNKFFFIGCCREDGMGSDHLFWKMVESVQNCGISSKILQLDCVTEDVLNEVISRSLCLLPRQIRSLTRIVYSKTKGNPLFVCQLLLSLNRDGLLRIDMGKQRWVWDEEKILSTKLPDNVALCFTDGIKKLPIEVQLALHTLSMFGASARAEYLTTLESQLKVKIIEPLKIAAAEGLVNNIKCSYGFAHDRIQEASYKMIQEHDRLCNHLTYGRCLVKIAIETGDDEMMFTAVNQINLGGPSAVTDREEYFTMAQHNYVAGKRSMAMSDFNTAYSFFDHSMTFLRKNHWKDHYHFSLELFDLASKSALASGNIQGLRIIVDQLMKHALCFEDKLNIHFVILCSGTFTPKMSEVVEKGLQIVSMLGVDVPINPTQRAVDKQMEQTIAIVEGLMGSNLLLNYRNMTDSKMLQAMKFLSKIQNAAFFTNQLLVRKTVYDIGLNQRLANSFVT
jgi:predicted ATPase